MATVSAAAACRTLTCSKALSSSGVLESSSRLSRARPPVSDPARRRVQTAAAATASPLDTAQTVSRNSAFRPAGRNVSFSSCIALTSAGRNLLCTARCASSRPTSRQNSLVVRARGGGGDDGADVPQRLLAAAVYLMPFLDGARYGRYLYMQYPFTRVLLDPFVPLIQLYTSVPFAGVIVFFALYLAVIQNPNLSRYVRFNAMQAVILDILMILPSLFDRIFAFRDGVGFQLTVIFYNTVFLYLVACFVFGVASCLLGKTPRLPLVADAAEAQVPY